MSEGFSLLRQDPVLSLVEQAVVNQGEFSSGRICEFTKGYLPGKNEFEEKRYLGAVVFGKNNLPQARRANPDSSIFQLDWVKLPELFWLGSGIGLKLKTDKNHPGRAA